MKNKIGFLAIALVFIGCTSDNDMKYKETEKKEADKKEVKSETPVGIQNVNGNIPDTINTIDINNQHKKDTLKGTGKDTSK